MRGAAADAQRIFRVVQDLAAVDVHLVQKAAGMIAPIADIGHAVGQHGQIPGITAHHKGVDDRRAAIVRRGIGIDHRQLSAVSTPDAGAEHIIVPIRPLAHHLRIGRHRHTGEQRIAGNVDKSDGGWLIVRIAAGVGHQGGGPIDDDPLRRPAAGDEFGDAALLNLHYRHCIHEQQGHIDPIAAHQRHAIGVGALRQRDVLFHLQRARIDDHNLRRHTVQHQNFIAIGEYLIGDLPQIHHIVLNSAGLQVHGGQCARQTVFNKQRARHVAGKSETNNPPTHQQADLFHSLVLSFSSPQ
ncbi:MAG: hypothetical protein BWY83_02660 [bacterium ADurb.Bin478]|nr:MAG: hypothetical protein BWY83_02660 [bacterium ADurb.Bin478]